MDCKTERSTDPQSDESDCGLLGAEVLVKDANKYVYLLAPNNNLFSLKYHL
jgi:hypothetical protein